MTILGLVLTMSANAQLTATYDNIMIPMRDNETLEADVYIPAGVDSAEVILIQTPYNKEMFSLSLPMGVNQNLDSQPYIWVIVDWRGFYGSAGADLSNFTRGEDGYDICEWISEQTWHLDRIGTWGASALGGVQYHTAREQHPNHTCAVPLVAHPHSSYDSYFYGGVLEEARLETLDLLGYGLSPLIMANTYYSTTWQFAEMNSWYPQDINIPTLQIGGWYDHNIDKMMTWYEATRNSSGAAVQDEQWLLVGPWAHGGTGAAYVGSNVQGELTYPNAEYVSDTMAWDFLAYYLLDAANGWNATPMITYYEIGLDQWNSSNSTSIDDIGTEFLYLDGDLLSPTIGNVNASFVCDPTNPSPTIGGANLHTNLDQGPYDQNSLDARSDVISYTSHPLTTDVQISGRVKVTAYVESDQPDGDIVVRLVDKYPDGHNMLITDGIQRMRLRNGLTQADEAFMQAGSVYTIEIDLPYTNYTWQAGHQIKVYVSGNSFNRWNVNPQNDGPMYTPGDTNVANIIIHQSATYPSSIELPGTNPSLSLSDNPSIEALLYPNPTTGIFSLKAEGITELQIRNSLGQLLMTQIAGFDHVDVTDLPSGIYFATISTTEGNSTIKFVIE